MFVLEWEANSGADCVCPLSSLCPAQVSSVGNVELPTHPTAPAGLGDRPVRSKGTSVTMSIEYTIDIQLTELGFPEIVPRNSSGRETSSRSISASQKQKVQHADETSDDAAAVRRKAAHPSKSAQGGQVKGKTGDSTAGTVNTTLPTAGQGDDRDGEEAGEDSDDSDVSGVCEEEEINNSDDEDGLYSGMLLKFT